MRPQNMRRGLSGDRCQHLLSQKIEQANEDAARLERRQVSALRRRRFYRKAVKMRRGFRRRQVSAQLPPRMTERGRMKCGEVAE